MVGGEASEFPLLLVNVSNKVVAVEVDGGSFNASIEFGRNSSMAFRCESIENLACSAEGLESDD